MRSLHILNKFEYQITGLQCRMGPKHRLPVFVPAATGEGCELFSCKSRIHSIFEEGLSYFLCGDIESP